MHLKALLKRKPVISPLVFLGMIVLSFGIYIPWLGLYGDDWQYLYVFHLLGAGEYPAFVAPDRPFSAWVYQLFTPVFGETVWAYHLLVLLLRWLAALSFWWVLKLLWPEKPRLIIPAVLLFCVYPGFKQMALPLEFILHFTIMLMSFLSLGMMLKSLQVNTRRLQWSYTAIGLALAAGMFSVEYFLGLELLRPVLVWFCLRDKDLTWKKRLLKSLTVWVPYLLVLVLFFIWRVFIFSFQYYEPAVLNRIIANPLKGVFQLIWKILSDLWLLIAGVWDQSFAQSGSYIHVLTAAGVLILFSAIVFLLLKLVVDENSDDSQSLQDEKWGLQALGLGLLSLLFAGWPFWLVDVPIQSGFPWDRPSLAFMPGAALFWAGLLVIIVQPRARLWILTGVVSLAMVFHYQNALTYINEWKQVKQVFQQLIWRAPELEKNTFLLTDGIPFLYYGDNTLSPALNWVYAPGLHDNTVPYRVFDLNIRRQTTFKEIGRNMPVEHNYRSFKFSGSTDQMVAFHLSPGKCLRVLGPQDQSLPDIPDQLGDVLYMSRLDLIKITDASDANLPHVFGSAVEKDWCYYFESAELAGQLGEWDKVVELYRESTEKGFVPYSPGETAVFIKGFIHSGDLESAEKLATSMVQDETFKAFTCDTWQNAISDAQLQESVMQEAQMVLNDLGCGQ